MSIFWVWWVSWTSPNVRQIWKSSPQCQHVQCKCSACAVHVELLQGTLKTVCSPESCLSSNISEISPHSLQTCRGTISLLLWSSLIFFDLRFDLWISFVSHQKDQNGQKDWKNTMGKPYKIHRTILEHYWSQCQGADPQSFDLSRTALAEMDHPKCEKAPDDSRPRMPKDAQGQGREHVYV